MKRIIRQSIFETNIQYDLTDDVKYMFYLIKNERVDK